MISMVLGGLAGFGLVGLIALPRYIHTRKKGSSR